MIQRGEYRGGMLLTVLINILRKKTKPNNRADGDDEGLIGQARGASIEGRRKKRGAYEKRGGKKYATRLV